MWGEWEEKEEGVVGEGVVEGVVGGVAAALVVEGVVGGVGGGGVGGVVGGVGLDRKAVRKWSNSCLVGSWAFLPQVDGVTSFAFLRDTVHLRKRHRPPEEETLMNQPELDHFLTAFLSRPFARYGLYMIRHGTNRSETRMMCGQPPIPVQSTCGSPTQQSASWTSRSSPCSQSILACSGEIFRSR